MGLVKIRILEIIEKLYTVRTMSIEYFNIENTSVYKIIIASRN